MEQILYDGFAPLVWTRFEGAEAYWVEVAIDPGFNQMQVSEWGVRATSLETAALPPHTYHWRVAALDRLGLPGQGSHPQSFVLRKDDTPPFLTLLLPGDGQIVTEPQVEVLGASEPASEVALNGVPVEMDRDGSFIIQTALIPGPNILTLRSVDPAGTESSIAQTVIYRPAAQISISLSPALPRVETALATRSTELSVFAASTAATGAEVLVKSADGIVGRTVVGTAGAISFSVPAEVTPRSYEVAVLGPTGGIEGQLDFEVLRDQIAPVITLDTPPPTATDLPDIKMIGNAGDAAEMRVNGVDVPLTSGAFEVALNLPPGVNVFDLVATDPVGNVTATRLQTVYDIEPPVVQDITISRPQGEAGPIEIALRASDESGLRQAAQYVLQVGSEERAGFLRCDSATGLCRATLSAQPGALQLIKVIVEDYAGNAAFK